MTKVWFIVLLSVVGLLGVISAQESTCSYFITSANAFYDFSPVYTKEFNTKDNMGNTYYYSPCFTVSESECTKSAFSAACQKDAGGSYYNIGSMVFFNKYNVSINTQYKEAFDLYLPGATIPPPARQTTVTHICNPNVDFVLKPGNPVENPLHNYYLIVESKYACRTIPKCANSLVGPSWYTEYPPTATAISFSTSSPTVPSVLKSSAKEIAVPLASTLTTPVHLANTSASLPPPVTLTSALMTVPLSF